MFWSALAHYPSTGLLILGCAVLVVLADAEGWRLHDLRGVLAFNASVFALAVLSCQRGACMREPRVRVGDAGPVVKISTLHDSCAFQCVVGCAPGCATLHINIIAAYLSLCFAVFVAMFGPGVTLFSLVVFGLLAVVGFADRAQATAVRKACL